MNTYNLFGRSKRQVVLLALAAMCQMAFLAHANVTVTPATGGTGISADTAGTVASNLWTTLGAFTITEPSGASGRNNFGTGTGVTLILAAPTGFEFNTAVTPSITRDIGGDISSASVAVPDSTHLRITMTVTGTSTNDFLTIGSSTGLQVRPAAIWPLSTGQIARPATNGGTATIVGLTTSTNAAGFGGLNFGTLSMVAGTNKPGVLILYDGTGSFAWIANLHAKMLANLMGHFNLSYVIKPVENYASNDVDHVLATFYLGMTADNPLPQSFKNDVVTTTNTVCWFKDNIWEISGPTNAPSALNQKCGFVVNFLDGQDSNNIPYTNIDTTIVYKGVNFDKNPADPLLGAVQLVSSNLNPPAVSFPMIAWRTNHTANTVYSVPYATHGGGNFWYIGDSPFDFMTETSRYIPFVDLLHDILGIDHAESHQAVIRLEDVTMDVYDAGDLTNSVNTLRTNNVPFAMATIPVYYDPLGFYNNNVPEEHAISDSGDDLSVEMLRELKYALTNGGQIITHGYTHQYNNVHNPSTGTSADDFEFWRETINTNDGSVVTYQPVAEDNLAWVSGRFQSAADELAAAGLPTVGWEPPHYAASPLDYQYFATNTPLTMARVLYFSDDYKGTNFYHFPDVPPHVSGQFFPVTIQQDVYGQKIIPENLGNYEENPLPGSAPRNAAQIVDSARRNLVIRDGWANAFFHGFYNNSNLTQIVQGIKALGYTYVQLSPTGKPIITFQPKTQTNLATGLTVKLGVAAVGSDVLRYQWRLNGTNVVGATNSLLTLPSLQATDAGNYTAVVTNGFGAVTSSIATLTVNVPITITNQPQNFVTVVGSNATFNVGVSGTAPFSYQWFFNATNQLGGATNAILTVANVQLTNAGNYTVVITNVSAVVTSSVATLGIAAAPAVTNGPASQGVLLGSNAVFTVAVSGSAPLGYQWFFNQTNLLSGATNNPLTLTSVTLSNAGGYSVVVTNAFGVTTSSVATLSILLAPAITNQPDSLTNVLGATATFVVGVTGDQPLVYRWRFNGTNLAVATNNTLSVLNVQATNAGNYDVVVTNNSGSVTSAVATLTVNVPVFISVPPASRTNLAGTTATFTVTAGGSAPFAFQWRFGGTNLDSGTNSSLAITNVSTNNVGSYDVVITNNFGSVTSAPVLLTVNVPVFLTGQPLSVTNLQGSNAIFSVTVDGTAPFAYRWRFNNTNLPVAIATNSSLSITNIQATNAGNYTVVVTNSFGAVTSSIASLTVNVPVFIQTAPVNLTNLLGSTATFTVTAGGSAPFAYQWRSGGTNLDSGTNNSLAITNVSTNNVGSYDVVITNNFGSVTSAPVSLTVNVPVFITGQPQSVTNLQGSNAIFSVTVDGTAPFAYRWRFNNTNLPVAIATNSSLTLTNLQATNAGNYTVVVTNSFGAVTSSIASLTVNVPAFIQTAPASRTNLAGTTALFTVTAGGTAPFTYQWQFAGADLNGATNSSLSLANVQTNNAGSYAVIITNNFGAVTSAPVSLTVNVPVFITSQPSSLTNLQGDNVNFSVAVNGTAPFAYRWRLNGTNLPAAVATNSTLAINNVQATNAGSYTVVITNNFGAVTSSIASLTVNVPVFVNTQPASRTNLLGSSATFNVTAGGTAPFAYQWRFGGTNLDSATNSSFTVAAVQTNDVGGYDVVITNNFGAVTSSIASLSVNVPVFIIGQPQSVTNLQGTNISFAVVAGGTAPFTYQWRFNGTNLAPAVATNSLLAIANIQATNGGNYDVIVGNSFGSVTSSVATLTVNVPVFILAQPQSTTNLAGTDAGFTVTAGGTDPFSYQWRFAGTNIIGETNSLLIVPDVDGTVAGNYDVIITNNFGSVTSSIAGLVVQTPPFITSQPASRAISAGNSTTFTVAAGGDPVLAYQWRLNGTNLAGANTTAYTLPDVQLSDAGGYSVVITNNYGSVTSIVATLTVSAPPSITSQPLSQTNQPGTSVTFTVAATGTGTLSYQWHFNTFDIPGATGNSLTVNNVTATNAGAYSVTVANLIGSTVSQDAVLTVTSVSPLLKLRVGAGNALLLSFATINGLTYHIEYVDDIAPTGWQELGSLPGDGSTFEFQVDGGTNHRRFYRVRVE